MDSLKRVASDTVDAAFGSRGHNSVPMSRRDAVAASHHAAVRINLEADVLAELLGVGPCSDDVAGLVIRAHKAEYHGIDTGSTPMMQEVD